MRTGDKVKLLMDTRPLKSLFVPKGRIGKITKEYPDIGWLEVQFDEPRCLTVCSYLMLEKVHA